MDFSKIRIAIVTLTVGNWDLMDQHIKSIYDTYPFEKDFYIIPNIEYEWSLSGAINKGFWRALNDGHHFIIYSADDVIVGENCIQDLVSHLLQNDVWMVNGVGQNTSGWDMFAAVPALFENVGFWNQSFYPAYFEDNDFARRLSLCDDTKYAYIPVNFQHLGSQTVQRMTPNQKDQHHANFQRLERMYKEMWGGPPGQEVFTQAWNGDRPVTFEGHVTYEPERWEPN